MKNDEEIIRTFFSVDTIKVEGDKLFWDLSPSVRGLRVTKEIRNPKTKQLLLGAGKKISASVFQNMKQAKLKRFEIVAEDLEGALAVADLVDTSTGEVIVEANNELTPTILRSLMDAGVPEIPLFFPETDDIGVVLSQTLAKDTIKAPEEALIEIYRKLRPGDPPTLDTATTLFQGMFFDARKYDLSRVGRLKFNIKLDLTTPLENRIPGPERLLRSHHVSAQTAKVDWPGRRHRPSGQPPSSGGWRIARKSVQNRTCPDGTSH